MQCVSKTAKGEQVRLPELPQGVTGLLVTDGLELDTDERIAGAGISFTYLRDDADPLELVDAGAD